MNLAEIEEACGAPLQEGWDMCLRDLAATSTTAELDDALRWATERRDELLATCREIADPEDLEHTVVMMYIELKSAWIMYNTTIGYQYMSRGGADPTTVLRASLVSQAIAVIEPLLSAEALESISEFFAQPVA